MKATLVLLVLAYTVAVAYGIHCTPNFCENVECVQLKPCDCKPPQVYTANGGTCGCCPICITYLGENENCQNFRGVAPRAICSPPLQCRNGVCTKVRS